MPDAPGRVEAHREWDRIQDTHDVVYLVKHLAYEIAFAIPKILPNRPLTERALVLARFTQQEQMRDIIFELADMEDFHDDLSCLLEYIWRERARRRHSL